MKHFFRHVGLYCENVNETPRLNLSWCEREGEQVGEDLLGHERKNRSVSVQLPRCVSYRGGCVGETLNLFRLERKQRQT